MPVYRSLVFSFAVTLPEKSAYLYILNITGLPTFYGIIVLDAPQFLN